MKEFWFDAERETEGIRFMVAWTETRGGQLYVVQGSRGPVVGPWKFIDRSTWDQCSYRARPTQERIAKAEQIIAEATEWRDVTPEFATVRSVNRIDELASRDCTPGIQSYFEAMALNVEMAV